MKPYFTMKQSEWDALSPAGKKAMAEMAKALNKKGDGMSRTEIPKEFEVWVCAHTKKCRWSGSNSELVHIPDPRMMPGAYRGTCPRCGDHSFYIKDSRTFKPTEPDTAQACKEWIEKHGEVVPGGYLGMAALGELKSILARMKGKT